MATINVVISDGEAWLTLAGDPALSVHATFPKRSSSRDTAGEVRGYAGGRTRVITSARKTATFPLTLQLLTDADVALLESWQGQVLLLRDGASRREWVSFLSCDVEDLWDVDGTLHNAGLVFTALTYVEGV